MLLPLVLLALAVVAPVAILTGPGGPVLPSLARRHGHPVHVAILTGPGGPVLPSEHAWSAPDQRVAILTGPGGPVLPIRDWMAPRSTVGLRSSPAPEGRCCIQERLVGVDMIWLRSSPAPEGRCCQDAYDHHRLDIALRSSPAPEGRCCRHRAQQQGSQGEVAILTGPGGPVLRTRTVRPCPHRKCCDPHRPRRAGAARQVRLIRLHPRVAILTGPGGPVLPTAAPGAA